jgi:low affinity Fe/Cu permease
VFDKFARRITEWMGSPLALVIATLVCVAWALNDRPFDWLDGVSAATLWMLFVVQSTQNRDTSEMRRELRELVRATPQADESVIPQGDD